MRSLAVVVHDSGDGAVMGSSVVPTPTPGYGADIAGAGDDRTFVVGAREVGPHDNASYHLFLLRVSSEGVPGRFAGLPAAITLGRYWVSGLALSPDGSRLAVTIQGFSLRGPEAVFSPFAVVDVVSLNTLQILSWRSPAPGYWAADPSWVSEHTVVFAWWRESYQAGVSNQIVGFGQLDTADRRAPLPGALTPAPVSTLSSAVFASGSTRGVAAACSKSGAGTVGTFTASIGGISRTGASLFQVFHSESQHFIDTYTAETLGSSCAVMSLDPSGQHALVYGFGFGRLDGGVFTPLPAQDGSTSAAW